MAVSFQEIQARYQLASVRYGQPIREFRQFVDLDREVKALNGLLQKVRDNPATRKAVLCDSPVLREVFREIGQPNCLRSFVHWVRDSETGSVGKVVQMLAQFFLFITVVGYFKYSSERDRQELNVIAAREYDSKRKEVERLRQQYLSWQTLTDGALQVLLNHEAAHSVSRSVAS